MKNNEATIIIKEVNLKEALDLGIIEKKIVKGTTCAVCEKNKALWVLDTMLISAPICKLCFLKMWDISDHSEGVSTLTPIKGIKDDKKYLKEEYYEE